MNFLRFSDLCASGQATGKRVFIRADLNVPLEVTRPHACLLYTSPSPRDS